MMNEYIRNVEADEAIQTGSKLEYALLYMMSELVFCRGKDINLQEINFDECLEARFFGPEKEVHLFRNDDRWTAVVTEDKEDLDHIDRKYRLSKNHQNTGIGRELIVREYIGYDEDGQAYIEKTRLAGIC